MANSEAKQNLLDRYKTGDDSAAGDIFQRYSERLCALAESQIGVKLGQKVGSEDIVQSVFRTFFRRATNGQFAIDHSGALWHLLVQITLNKVRKQVERYQTKRRDVSSEISMQDEFALAVEAIDREPTADEAAALTDECERIVSEFEADEVEIFELALEGYSTTEIGRRVGCSRWTVRRVLDRIGNCLQDRLQM